LAKNLLKEQWKQNKYVDGEIVENEQCILLKPNGFINLSGHSVKKAIEHFKIPTENLLIFTDDINLPLLPGGLNLKFIPKSNEHNGVQSIVTTLGLNKMEQQQANNKLSRILRIGVGPIPKGQLRSNYVLARFSQKEQEILKTNFDLCLDAIETLLKTNHFDFVQTKWNKKCRDILAEFKKSTTEKNEQIEKNEQQKHQQSNGNAEINLK